MQTRKWQDQQTNQEKYTTEIVLTRFRGELTLLDSRGAGGEGRESFGGGEERPSFSSSRSSGGGERRPALAPAASSGGADLDDDIPF